LSSCVRGGKNTTKKFRGNASPSLAVVWWYTYLGELGVAWVR
jgi:hypothetical protein